MVMLNFFLKKKIYGYSQLHVKVLQKASQKEAAQTKTKMGLSRVMGYVHMLLQWLRLRLRLFLRTK